MQKTGSSILSRSTNIRSSITAKLAPFIPPHGSTFRFSLCSRAFAKSKLTWTCKHRFTGINVSAGPEIRHPKYHTKRVFHFTPLPKLRVVSVCGIFGSRVQHLVVRHHHLVILRLRIHRKLHHRSPSKWRIAGSLFFSRVKGFHIVRRRCFGESSKWDPSSEPGSGATERRHTKPPSHAAISTQYMSPKMSSNSCHLPAFIPKTLTQITPCCWPSVVTSAKLSLELVADHTWLKSECAVSMLVFHSLDSDFRRMISARERRAKTMCKSSFAEAPRRAGLITCALNTNVHKSFVPLLQSSLDIFARTCRLPFLSFSTTGMCWAAKSGMNLMPGASVIPAKKASSSSWKDWSTWKRFKSPSAIAEASEQRFILQRWSYMVCVMSLEVWFDKSAAGEAPTGKNHKPWRRTWRRTRLSQVLETTQFNARITTY